MMSRDDEAIVVVSGIPILIGEPVSVVIEGDGVNGVFTGRVAAITGTTIRLVLTASTATIPAGSIVAIEREDIAAIARRPTNMVM